MLSILVLNLKGGCGKTTIATNLAGAFAVHGLPVALAEVDRQKSALDWLKRRDKALAPIVGLDWRKEHMAPPKRTSRLVIDAPAGVRGQVLEDLVKSTDIVLVPVLPSPFDEGATQRFVKRLDALKPVRKGKRAVGLIANRVRLRARSAARLDEFLEGLDHAAIATLRDSSLYGDLAMDGMSIFDAKGTRAANQAEDWRPLLSFIEQHAE